MDDQIRQDNKHFQGTIIKYPVELEVVGGGGRGKQHMFYGMRVGCTGNHYEAYYYWNKSLKFWELGSN